jgi:hypothetical protein
LISDRSAPRKQVGALPSSWRRPRTAAPPRSCADPVNRSLWYGDGRRGSWPRASKGRGATRRASPAKSRFRPPRYRTSPWDRRRGSNPFDRPDAGEGGRREPAFSAADPRGPPNRARQESNQQPNEYGRWMTRCGTRRVSARTPASVADATTLPAHRKGGRHRFRAAADHRRRP